MNRTILVGAALLSFAGSNALAAYCEDIHPNYRNGGGTKFGPFDYRDATLQKRERGTPLQLVEEAHFTEKVRTLKGGNTSQYPGGDLSYTLWAFPNHHQALLTLINYTVKYNNERPPQMSFSTECYFKRAIQWRPDDSKAHSVYGIYLFKKAKFQESITRFLEAIKLDPSNFKAHYFLGLVLRQLGDPDWAIKEFEVAQKSEDIKTKCFLAKGT